MRRDALTPKEPRGAGGGCGRAD